MLIIYASDIVMRKVLRREVDPALESLASLHLSSLTTVFTSCNLRHGWHLFFKAKGCNLHCNLHCKEERVTGSVFTWWKTLLVRCVSQQFTSMSIAMWTLYKGGRCPPAWNQLKQFVSACGNWRGWVEKLSSKANKRFFSRGFVLGNSFSTVPNIFSTVPYAQCVSSHCP